MLIGKCGGQGERVDARFRDVAQRGLAENLATESGVAFSMTYATFDTSSRESKPEGKPFSLSDPEEAQPDKATEAIVRQKIVGKDDFFIIFNIIC